MTGHLAETLLITADRESSIHGAIGDEVESALNEKTDCAQFDEIEFMLSNDGIELTWGTINLNNYQRVIMYGGVTRSLRITYPLAVALLANGANVYTSGAENFKGLDKLSQNVLFAVNKIPIPRTYFASPELIIKNAKSKIGFPLILKDILASQGQRNYLIHNQDQLESYLDAMKENRYITQQFINNESDLRVLINAEGKIVAFKRSSAAGSHLNNISAGGTAVLEESISDEVTKSCTQIVKVMSMPLLGIDVIIAGDSHWVLEANTQPQIFTGAFVEEKKQFFQAALHK